MAVNHNPTISTTTYHPTPPRSILSKDSTIAYLPVLPTILSNQSMLPVSMYAQITPFKMPIHQSACLATTPAIIAQTRPQIVASVVFLLTWDYSIAQITVVHAQMATLTMETQLVNYVIAYVWPALPCLFAPAVTQPSIELYPIPHAFAVLASMIILLARPATPTPQVAYNAPTTQQHQLSFAICVIQLSTSLCSLITLHASPQMLPIPPTSVEMDLSK